MKIIVSVILLILSFLGLILLGMDIDKRFPRISHILLAYYIEGAIVCGIVIGLCSAFLLMS